MASRIAAIRGELARFYRAADLFVHPGVQETFGLVTLESQACGTPVVGIRGSYMDRIVFSDLGYWAAENRPESLAAAIEPMSRADLRARRSAQQRHRGRALQLAAAFSTGFSASTAR